MPGLKARHTMRDEVDARPEGPAHHARRSGCPA
jgi:hypothetical protein